MESLLNIVWLAVAGALVCIWVRDGGRDRPERRRQLIAMAVLIAILFPVISVSDDLLAIQNAFEADNTYSRRDHLVPSSTHPVQPVITILAAAMFAGIALQFLRFVAPSMVVVKGPQHPELTWIENRPPPGA
jgi:hypothetical protein